MTIHSSVSIGISNAFIIYFFSCGGIIAFELLHGRETYGIVWKRMGTYGNVRLPNRHVVSLHQIPKRGKTYRRSFRPVTDVFQMCYWLGIDYCRVVLLTRITVINQPSRTSRWYKAIVRKNENPKSREIPIVSFRLYPINRLIVTLET